MQNQREGINFGRGRGNFRGGRGFYRGERGHFRGGRGGSRTNIWFNLGSLSENYSNQKTQQDSKSYSSDGSDNDELDMNERFSNLNDQSKITIQPRTKDAKPLFDQQKPTNKYQPPTMHCSPPIKTNSSDNYANNDSENYKNRNISIGNRYHPKTNDGNYDNSYSKQSSKRDYYKNTKIQSKKDVFIQLRDKLKPNLRNVDEKIYYQLDKYNQIVDYISSNMGDQMLDAFFELCKVFTLPDLISSKDPSKQSSIFAIFFEGDRFKLSNVIEKVIIGILLNNVSDENINLMFNFFKVLIDVSSVNFENLQKEISMLDEISNRNPFLQKQVNDLKYYTTLKEENEINSFESKISPTAEDLFHSKIKKIKNSINKSWSTFNEYKRAMIDLTKENFYLPFRSSLDNLRERKLDPRDLFLYQDVFIPFTTNIDNYNVFKDCNFFLSFKIRKPPNWKKKMTAPDWKHTEQLGNRSLLILSSSPDLLTVEAVCRSCAVARSPDQISSRTTIDFLNRGIVPVVLISGQIKENVKYYMFEPTSCWPAVQPVLQRLLKMNEHSFPPSLLNKVTKLDFSDNKMQEKNQIQTDVLMLNRPTSTDEQRIYLKMASEPWPFDRYTTVEINSLLRVDNEQYRALRYALTHSLTLVNGAPGTGKTHFAREYLRVMMNLRHPKPIVVVTYTNHALDSILEGVLQFLSPDDLIRWGGPMRSKNQKLIDRKWKNYYLTRDIRDQKNEIVTKKQNLKNMYNIRQMAAQSINAITKNPQDIRIYTTIMKVLNYFFKASEIMASHYPTGLNPEETEEYNRYLNSRDDRIEYLSLPSNDDALICWLNGETYFNERNFKIRETLNHNKSVMLGETYQNPFANLNSNSDYEEEDEKEKERERIRNKQSNNIDPDDYYDNYSDDEIEEKPKEPEIHPSPEDFGVNQQKDDQLQQQLSQQILNLNENENENENINTNNDDDVNNNKKEEEEEEEEFIEDKIYNDENIIEMTRVSFEGTEITENLPKVYVDDFLEGKFSDLFAVKDPNNKKTPDELMIDYLKAISSPLTLMIEKIESELQKDEIEFNDKETRDAGRYLSKMRLIGMTSTVASVRKEALEVAGCEILIVEEAGELTESMLCCILPSTLKRMILIGDYQQLRPKVEHEMTGEPCNYDISLFEKLVVNAKDQRADCLFTLSVQRRMHPQISALIRNVFYDSGIEKITDAESTNELGIPYGIPHRVRFFMHQYEESKVATRSHVNIQEAKFCASLVPFFICRGYKPEDITIISLYKGQMYQIQREIEILFNKCKNDANSKLFNPFGNIRDPKYINVVVLDNFQGEENKIIIVSLTRSDKPGFVKNRNRALVTLSRAREMLIVLGHERVFGKDCKNNEQWRKISTAASKLSRFSMSTQEEQGIAVNKCSIHKPNSSNIPSFLQTPESVFQYKFSFCKETCNHDLPCGHKCQLACHCHSYPPGPEEHDDYFCPFQCEKKCENGHRCVDRCGRCTHRGFCPPCYVKIRHVFPCKHEATIECYLVTSGKAKCHAECGKTLDRCGHPCRLQCGHKGQCNCKVSLTKECENCHRTFYYQCGDEHPKCTRKCNCTLPCGHVCSSLCSVCIERGHHDTECKQRCEFFFPCGHRCPHLCCDKFPSHHHFFCTEKVMFLHNYCGNHNFDSSLNQECSNPIVCQQKCQHYCTECHLSCQRNCSQKCIQRCKCRCKKQCEYCGKRCRCLSGEKCAIFCEHSKDFRNVKEPPEKVGLLYVFHGCHFLPLEEAKQKMDEQFDAIVNGAGESPVPIRRLSCPIEGCRCTEQCVVGSWLFDSYNKQIEDTLNLIRKTAERYIRNNRDNPEESQFDKIQWYKCENCNELFFIKYDDIDNIIVKCPNCGMQKGEMFE